MSWTRTVGVRPCSISQGRAVVGRSEQARHARSNAALGVGAALAGTRADTGGVSGGAVSLLGAGRRGVLEQTAGASGVGATGARINRVDLEGMSQMKERRILHRKKPDPYTQSTYGPLIVPSHVP